MKAKIEKTEYGKTIKLEDLSYSLPFIEDTFDNLQLADYGKGFSMATYGELVPLLHWAYFDKGKVAREVINAFSNSAGDFVYEELFGEDIGCSVIGNTGVLFTKKGMFVQDCPKIRNRDRNDKQNCLDLRVEELEDKLGKGSYRHQGIVFSDDKKVRFAENKNYDELMTPPAINLKDNTYVMALVGDFNKVNMLVDITLNQYKEGFETNPDLQFSCLFGMDYPERDPIKGFPAIPSLGIFLKHLEIHTIDELANDEGRPLMKKVFSCGIKRKD